MEKDYCRVSLIIPTMSIKRCLILTASYGSGHNAAKNTLKHVFESRGAEVASLDLVSLLKNKGGVSSRSFYELSEFFPIMWKIMFNILDKELSNEVLTSAMKVVAQNRFDSYIRSYKPDCIIAVFPLWAKLVQNYCEKYGKTFSMSVIVTDSMDVGMGWYFGQEVVDRYFVIDKYTKKAFEKKFDHKRSNILTSFFPIEPRFL
jgi:processive 1,2-diacylglycerol beta-glucosyltransferase